MESSASVYCPFCGQKFEVTVDTNTASQVLTVDCEICCRPIELRIECEAGEILSLDVAEN
jgi:transcription elongation factor Elf1